MSEASQKTMYTAKATKNIVLANCCIGASLLRGAQYIFLKAAVRHILTSHVHVRPPDLEKVFKNSLFHKHFNDRFYFNQS